MLVTVELDMITKGNVPRSATLILLVAAQQLLMLLAQLVLTEDLTRFEVVSELELPRFR